MRPVRNRFAKDGRGGAKKKYEEKSICLKSISFIAKNPEVTEPNFCVTIYICYNFKPAIELVVKNDQFTSNFNY